jgi:hypothetical protein
LRVDYLKFKRDIFPAVLAARRRAASCTIDALVVWTVMRSFKAARAFFRRLEEGGKLVKLSSDSSDLKLATGMISPDEWIHRGLEFAWKALECRSEDRGGGGTGGENQDIADELKWLDLAIECFSKAGSSGNKYVSKAQLDSRCTRFLKELQKPTAASIQQTEKDGIKLVAACIKEGMWLEAPATHGCYES